ncbi:MAG: phosphopantothenoylcysteine decarboxylase, partial [Acidimicrobiales bacterium]
RDWVDALTGYGRALGVAFQIWDDVRDLVGTEDVLGKIVSGKREHQVIVGFAAETERHEEAYREKLHAKGVSLLVGNDVSDPTIGFGSERNAVSILVPGEPIVVLSTRDKRDIAGEVLARAEAMLPAESN